MGVPRILTDDEIKFINENNGKISQNQIAKSLNVAQSKVSRYLSREKEKGNEYFNEKEFFKQYK